MADEAGWTTYDKQRRFRGKNPLRPTLMPEEEMDPEAVLVPEMMDMITKAEWMGLSKEERARRMLDLDEINDGHVDENSRRLQEAGKWTHRSAGADIDNDGHVDDMRSGAYGGGGAITLVGSAHRASQQFRTEKFEGEIDAGYQHRPRGKSGLEGFSIKQLIEKRKQDELKNKNAERKSKPRFSWMSKMQEKRKGNIANKWLARVASTPEIKKGASKKSTASKNVQRQTPQHMLSSMEEEEDGSEETEEQNSKGSFDGAAALSLRIDSTGGIAPREKRLTQMKLQDAVL
jgi:hypothetical protein